MVGTWCCGRQFWSYRRLDTDMLEWDSKLIYVSGLGAVDRIHSKGMIHRNVNPGPCRMIVVSAFKLVAFQVLLVLPRLVCNESLSQWQRRCLFGWRTATKF